VAADVDLRLRCAAPLVGERTATARLFERSRSARRRTGELRRFSAAMPSIAAVSAAGDDACRHGARAAHRDLHG
jgi:hypothetical protein